MGDAFPVLITIGIFAALVAGCMFAVRVLGDTYRRTDLRGDSSDERRWDPDDERRWGGG